MASGPIFTFDPRDADITLYSPTSVPTAGGYLWNQRLLLNMTCQGYANVHFMQPEPASYSTGPAIEAKTFLQPEHQYYPGHPGRFFYFHDAQQGLRFSAPYAPMKVTHDEFQFIVKKHKLVWLIKQKSWLIEMSVHLPPDDIAELWELRVTNNSNEPRSLEHCSCFNIGNQSWMNQSANFDHALNAIVADKVSPYQKTEDYEKQKHFKEKTYLLSEHPPHSWTASLRDFIGDGDWQNPQSIQQSDLPCSAAIYETPIAAMRFSNHYKAGESQVFRFVFGSATDKANIRSIEKKYLHQNGFRKSESAAIAHDKAEQSCIHVSTPDTKFNHFVNHWLSRQVIYHGNTQRLTTDPQTRNFLQDAMGMCFVNPSVMRTALLTTLAQQSYEGEIPDGVLLHPDAELKYINQVPHSDHATWVPICLAVYIDETNDTSILFELVGYANSQRQEPVWQHVQKAMNYLHNNLDDRSLSLIAQGDWCDPMNMVGYKGKGVSAWLTMATSWSFQLWGRLCTQIGKPDLGHLWYKQALRINRSINLYFWRNGWYARGITDEGRTFGTQEDHEGKIFLNPQSWALLCNAADRNILPQLKQAVNDHLMSAHGPEMLSPPYTAMQEDIGRLTQKFPGVAENGAVYCHAAAFYIYALWKNGHADDAFAIVDRLITQESNCELRGQLPVFIPNYFRGAKNLYPSHCGRSSRLFNTGTVAWVLRTIVEELCGLKGCEEGLHIDPKLPSHWPELSATRNFRGHTLHLKVVRSTSVDATQITVDGSRCATNVIVLTEKPKTWVIEVQLPESEQVTQ